MFDNHWRPGPRAQIFQTGQGASLRQVPVKELKPGPGLGKSQAQEEVGDRQSTIIRPRLPPLLPPPHTFARAHMQAQNGSGIRSGKQLSSF